MTSEETPDKPQTKAIAVKQFNVDAAPRLTAKGEGKLAERILDIAFAEGVKVRQDKDLTELLSSFDVESPVPLEALQAVSLILERVYAENNKMRDEQAVTDSTPDGPKTDDNQDADAPVEPGNGPTIGDKDPC